MNAMERHLSHGAEWHVGLPSDQVASSDLPDFVSYDFKGLSADEALASKVPGKSQGLRR
jgi:hypothetical protein